MYMYSVNCGTSGIKGLINNLDYEDKSVHEIILIKGGLKAVVWTDFIQAFFMFGAMLLIIIKGTVDLGGLDVVLQRNRDSGRLELPL